MFVTMLSGQTQSVLLWVSVHEFVKMKIQEEMGVAVEQQRLVHSGRTVLDDDALEDFGIHRGDTI